MRPSVYCFALVSLLLCGAATAIPFLVDDLAEDLECAACAAQQATTKAPTSFMPTEFPTLFPTRDPTDGPSLAPSLAPSYTPTMVPTAPPTAKPSAVPTRAPTNVPTVEPTRDPTEDPTLAPSLEPSFVPTTDPTEYPTLLPTLDPSRYPTPLPSVDPTRYPSDSPTRDPTLFPSMVPTLEPTRIPSLLPTRAPTTFPTSTPTRLPSMYPSRAPTIASTRDPTEVPTTGTPTCGNGVLDLACKGGKSISNFVYGGPTKSPTYDPSQYPTLEPSLQPTGFPSAYPTFVPSQAPSDYPSALPSATPSVPPSAPPTAYPSRLPTRVPSAFPTVSPTYVPTDYPSRNPTKIPTDAPTRNPTKDPTAKPTRAPTKDPSVYPTFSPTAPPTADPSLDPTAFPSSEPSRVPSSMPTLQPSHVPSNLPTAPPEEGDTLRKQLEAQKKANATAADLEEQKLNEVSSLKRQLLVAEEVGRWLAPIFLVLSMVGLYGMVDKLVRDLSKDGKLHRFELNDYQCIMVFVSTLALGLFFIFDGYFPEWFGAFTGVIGRSPAIRLTVMLLLWALPANVAFWSFTVLVFHWAGILYGGPKMGARAGNAMGGLRTVFLVTNGVLSVESVTCWVLILVLPDPKIAAVVAFSDQLLFAFTALVLSVSVLFFGISLSKTISKSAKRFAGSDAAAKRNRAAARKSAVVAITFSIIWLLSTVLRFIPAIAMQSDVVMKFFLDNRVALDLSYWVLNLFAICIVLFMYGPFKALSDWLSAKIDQLSKWHKRSHAATNGYTKHKDESPAPPSAGKEAPATPSQGITRIDSIGMHGDREAGIHTDRSGSKYAQA